MSNQPPKPTMQMFNVILTFDGYVVAGTNADSGDRAIEAAIELIRSGEINMTHFKALPMCVTPVRPACRDQRPLVAADVSDEDYTQIQGKTVEQAYDLITKRRAR